MLEEFIKKSIDRVKLASDMSLSHYGKPLVCEYSGGKDSDVLLWVFEQSGVPFEVHNSHTTVDAPPTVYHIRETFKRLELKGVKYPRSEQVRRCGNAVCPPIPAALVKANMPELCVAERTPNLRIGEEQSGQLRFA